MTSHRAEERRRRFVYVTRNTEYHVMDEVCVGVRDRQSRRWHERHGALARRLQGGVRILQNGAVIPSLAPPCPGDGIYFSSLQEGDVVTSRLEAIERPSFDDLVRYPAA